MERKQAMALKSILKMVNYLAQKVDFCDWGRRYHAGYPGFFGLLGISVIHCPYCHGYEFRGKKTAIMANGERALHLASLVNNLSTDLTILTSGEANFSAEQAAKLKKHGVTVIDEPVSKIQHKNGWVEKVIFKDNKAIAFDAVYAAIPFRQHSSIPVELGCDLTEQGILSLTIFRKQLLKGFLHAAIIRV
ncbi:hypothetical protein KUH03_35025 [Sphingobacterium sp. E70]|uniref:hypothetical protein n=1 Tax=Sphingobacterium sp. E70 TaxID=2853439 RepID=UPI00211C97B2|nr:hypothetical protein [Sphingobacterium sp. E70]ULT24194.1 hypothetical protein KUH03_35025 [Sphingobacterium sp. E70]